MSFASIVRAGLAIGVIVGVGTLLYKKGSAMLKQNEAQVLEMAERLSVAARATELLVADSGVEISEIDAAMLRDCKSVNVDMDYGHFMILDGWHADFLKRFLAAKETAEAAAAAAAVDIKQ